MRAACHCSVELPVQTWILCMNALNHWIEEELLLGLICPMLHVLAALWWFSLGWVSRIVVSDLFDCHQWMGLGCRWWTMSGVGWVLSEHLCISLYDASHVVLGCTLWICNWSALWWLSWFEQSVVDVHPWITAGTMKLSEVGVTQGGTLRIRVTGP